MAKPTDTRCRAKDEEFDDGRCEEEITINTRTGAWLVWCEGHQAQEEAARVDGGPRVEKVGAGASPS